MGYETKVFLVEAPGDLFTTYHPRDKWWGRDYIQERLPKDARICDGGSIFASIKLGKIGRGAIYSECLDLPGLIERDRGRQQEEKKFVALEWFPTDDRNTSEWPRLTDPYGDPYVISDAEEVLEALRNTIEMDRMYESVSRRLVIFEALLSRFVEFIPHGIVVSHGY